MEYDIKILERKINTFKEKYKEFKKNNEIDEEVLRECICDILSWIEICSKNKIKLDIQELKILSAFKYINNKKKHSNIVEKYNRCSKALLPSTKLYPSSTLYPSEFGIKWAEVSLDDTQYKNQYNNYINTLRGREIIPTLDIIFNIIKKNFN